MTKRKTRPRDGDVLLLVGTVKGAFIFRSSAKRAKWTEQVTDFFLAVRLLYGGLPGKKREVEKNPI